MADSGVTEQTEALTLQGTENGHLLNGAGSPTTQEGDSLVPMMTGKEQEVSDTLKHSSDMDLIPGLDMPSNMAECPGSMDQTVPAAFCDEPLVSVAASDSPAPVDGPPPERKSGIPVYKCEDPNLDFSQGEPIFPSFPTDTCSAPRADQHYDTSNPFQVDGHIPQEYDNGFPPQGSSDPSNQFMDFNPSHEQPPFATGANTNPFLDSAQSNFQNNDTLYTEQNYQEDMPSSQQVDDNVVPDILDNTPHNKVPSVQSVNPFIPSENAAQPIECDSGPHDFEGNSWTAIEEQMNEPVAEQDQSVPSINITQEKPEEDDEDGQSGNDDDADAESQEDYLEEECHGDVSMEPDRKCIQCDNDDDNQSYEQEDNYDDSEQGDYEDYDEDDNAVQYSDVEGEEGEEGEGEQMEEEEEDERSPEEDHGQPVSHEGSQGREIQDEEEEEEEEEGMKDDYYSDSDNGDAQDMEREEARVLPSGAPLATKSQEEYSDVRDENVLQQDKRELLQEPVIQNDAAADDDDDDDVADNGATDSDLQKFDQKEEEIVEGNTKQDESDVIDKEMQEDVDQQEEEVMDKTPEAGTAESDLLEKEDMPEQRPGTLGARNRNVTIESDSDLEERCITPDPTLLQAKMDPHLAPDIKTDTGYIPLQQSIMAEQGGEPSTMGEENVLHKDESDEEGRDNVEEFCSGVTQDVDTNMMDTAGHEMPSEADTYIQPAANVETQQEYPQNDMVQDQNLQEQDPGLEEKYEHMSKESSPLEEEDDDQEEEEETFSKEASPFDNEDFPVHSSKEASPFDQDQVLEDSDDTQNAPQVQDRVASPEQNLVQQTPYFEDQPVPASLGPDFDPSEERSPKTGSEVPDESAEADAVEQGKDIGGEEVEEKYETEQAEETVGDNETEEKMEQDYSEELEQPAAGGMAAMTGSMIMDSGAFDSLEQSTEAMDQGYEAEKQKDEGRIMDLQMLGEGQEAEPQPLEDKHDFLSDQMAGDARDEALTDEQEDEGTPEDKGDKYDSFYSRETDQVLMTKDEVTPDISEGQVAYRTEQFDPFKQVEDEEEEDLLSAPGPEPTQLQDAEPLFTEKAPALPTEEEQRTEPCDISSLTDIPTEPADVAPPVTQEGLAPSVFESLNFAKQDVPFEMTKVGEVLVDESMDNSYEDVCNQGEYHPEDEEEEQEEEYEPKHVDKPSTTEPAETSDDAIQPIKTMDVSCMPEMDSEPSAKNTPSDLLSPEEDLIKESEIDVQKEKELPEITEPKVPITLAPVMKSSVKEPKKEKPTTVKDKKPTKLAVNQAKTMAKKLTEPQATKDARSPLSRKPAPKRPDLAKPSPKSSPRPPATKTPSKVSPDKEANKPAWNDSPLMAHTVSKKGPAPRSTTPSRPKSISHLKPAVTPTKDRSSPEKTSAPKASPGKKESTASFLERMSRPNQRTAKKDQSSDSGVEEEKTTGSRQSSATTSKKYGIDAKNESYKPGGGNVKIKDQKVNLKNVSSRIDAKTSSPRKDAASPRPKPTTPTPKTPSPNKNVTSKVGSLANATHTPGGGKVKIQSQKKDYSSVQGRIGSTANKDHRPGGGDKKILSQKLEWKVESRIGSLDNAKHSPGGGNVKIVDEKKNWNVQSRVGSLDNAKHVPGGGEVKIIDEKKNWNVQSRVGSLDNAKHVAGGGEVKILNEKVEWKTNSRVGSLDNAKHSPGGGNVKIQSHKLEFKEKASSKVGSKDYIDHKPGGGDKKIESKKIDFKDKAASKVGSKDNLKHKAGGGDKKIETKKLDFKDKAASKVGSKDNMTHQPGGGDKKIETQKLKFKETAKPRTDTGSSPASGKSRPDSGISQDIGKGEEVPTQ